MAYRYIPPRNSIRVLMLFSPYSEWFDLAHLHKLKALCILSFPHKSWLTSKMISPIVIFINCFESIIHLVYNNDQKYIHSLCFWTLIPSQLLIPYSTYFAIATRDWTLRRNHVLCRSVLTILQQNTDRVNVYMTFILFCYFRLFILSNNPWPNYLGWYWKELAVYLSLHLLFWLLVYGDVYCSNINRGRMPESTSTHTCTFFSQCILTVE